MIEGILFYMFALVLLFSAVMVVTVRNPVHAVLFLVLAFFNGSALFLTLGAEFLAFVLLIVYVGAIAVLFLFVVMMLGAQTAQVRHTLKKEAPLALGIGGLLFVQMLVAVLAWPVQEIMPAMQSMVETTENTRALGHVLYTEFAFPFQISGLILLVAIIGAIVLTLRTRCKVKRQNVHDQMACDPKEVVELRHVKTGEGAS